MKKLILTMVIIANILHYHKQKFSPDTMVNNKQVKLAISAIYKWFHDGDLRLTNADMLYPTIRKGVIKQSSMNFKPVCYSIEERPDVINLRWKMIIMKFIPSF